MANLIVYLCTVVGFVVLFGLALAIYAENRRFLSEARWFENALTRRREIEDALRSKYPHVLILPAWDVVHTQPLNSAEYVVYTVAEDTRETPEQVASRITAGISSGQARSRVAPRVEAD